MTSPSKRKGDRAELEVQTILQNETRLPAASRPERVKFEETKHPEDFLRWLNAYTNTRRGGDDELHALCSWAHTVINALHFGWPE